MRYDWNRYGECAAERNHLMRCTGRIRRILRGQVQNNPQHRRILVERVLGTRLAGRWGTDHAGGNYPCP